MKVEIIYRSGCRNVYLCCKVGHIGLWGLAHCWSLCWISEELQVLVLASFCQPWEFPSSLNLNYCGANKEAHQSL